MGNGSNGRSSRNLNVRVRSNGSNGSRRPFDPNRVADESEHEFRRIELGHYLEFAHNLWCMPVWANHYVVHESQ